MAAPAPVFSLQGPAAGDYAYALKPGGVDYYRTNNGTTTPITREQYTSANFLSGNKGPAVSQLEGASNQGGATGSTGAAGTGGGTTYQDKSDDIAFNNQGLGAVDAQTQTGLAAVDKALGDVNGTYDTEDTAAQTKYQNASDQNQNNLDKNRETALVNAAQGRQGLFGTLAALGALNGSGLTLANNAVQKGANDDLSGAQDSYATNQTTEDNALADFKQQEAEARKAAATTAANDRTAVQNNADTQKQNFYKSLSTDYATEGDKANASKYSNLAGSLFPSLAGNSVPSTANLAATPLAFTPGTLSSYLSNGNTTASATPPQNAAASGVNGLPGLLVGGNNKRLQPA